MAFKSLIALVILMVTCISLSKAYTYIASDQGSSTDSCVDDNGVTRKINEEWTYDGQRCERATCIKMDTKLFHQIAGCGKILIPDTCEEVRDTTKRYPDCCPTMKC